jgi:pentapeptide MXKDX repeat protein
VSESRCAGSGIDIPIALQWFQSCHFLPKEIQMNRFYSAIFSISMAGLCGFALGQSAMADDMGHGAMSMQRMDKGDMNKDGMDKDAMKDGAMKSDAMEMKHKDKKQSKKEKMKEEIKEGKMEQGNMEQDSMKPMK